MTRRILTHLGSAAVRLTAATALALSTGEIQVAAQGSPPRFATDCTRLIAAQQAECFRTLRRLELRKMQEQRPLTSEPDRSGIATQTAAPPGAPIAPFESVRPRAGQDRPPYAK